ncbi:zinc finger, CCHC-type containing protein [Tanacetum coccineum]
MGDAKPIRTLGDYSKPNHEGNKNTIQLPEGNNVATLLDCHHQVGCKNSSNWLGRLPAGSISTWEELTSRFLAQFFPLGRTAKLRNDILMFQRHQGESLSEAWTRFKDLLQKFHYHGIDHWLQIQIFYEHVSFHLKCDIDRAASGKLRNKSTDEYWEIIENLALYDHEGWNDSKNIVKPVKYLYTSKTLDRRLLEFEDQINFLLKES